MTDYYPITAGLGIIKFTGDGTLTFHLSVEIGVQLMMVALSIAMLLCMKDSQDKTKVVKNKVKKQKNNY